MSSARREEFLALLRLAREIHGFEAALLRGNGDKMLCEISARTTEVGTKRLLLMVAVDITERRRVERKVAELNTELEQRVADRTAALATTNGELKSTVSHLRTAQAQLVRTEKLAALGRLVAGISHELNTPLGNALLALSTLNDSLRQLREESRQGLRRSSFERFVSDVGNCLEVTQRGLSRSIELVSAFKQVAVDRTTQQRRVFALREVLDETATLLAPSLRRTPFELRVEASSQLVMDSYPGPLGQVVANLIDNAVKHGLEGCTAGVVDVRAQDFASTHVELRCRDSGRGIPAEMLPRIFDPFFTTRMGRGGTGLGLHIAHSIVVDLLGGSIHVSSQVGGGTEFVVCLPYVAPQHEQTTERVTES